MQKSGLLIDPNFSASGVKWLLDNVEGAREAANRGELLMGTIDTWLVWKLTGGKTFATDTTNASRTMLFNIHTMLWDDDLLALFDIPRSMMPEVRACDAVYGETTCEGLFANPIQIAGVLGDSHGALVGQMCFEKGSGKVTYGTGSSVMVNIGEEAKAAPEGLVTSVGFSALGKTYYGFEGSFHSYNTGDAHYRLFLQRHDLSLFLPVPNERNPMKSNRFLIHIHIFVPLPYWQPPAVTREGLF